MPPRKRKTVDGAEESNSLTLTLEEGYAVPSFFSKATPHETCRGLSLAAAILDGETPRLFSTQMEVAAAVAASKEESMRQREQQLAAHEAALQKYAEDHHKALELQITTMQEKFDSQTAKQTESDNKIRNLLKENDDLEDKISEFESGGAVVASEAKHDEVRSFFEKHGQHSGEILGLLAEHHKIINQLNTNTVTLKAKIYAFHRTAKSLNMSTPWLNGQVGLPFDEAVDFAVARPYNNVTHTKANLIESNLGKAAFEQYKQSVNEKA
jgi:hypothetical protein